MRRIISTALLLCAVSVTAQQTIEVNVRNSSKSARTDEPVIIQLASYNCSAPHRDVRSALVTVEGVEIPC